MAEYAVIDIGTFSVLLLLAKAESPDRIDPLHEEYEIARLGEDVARTGRLSEAATLRTLEKLDQYRKTIDQHSVEAVYVVASDALRRAANSGTFVQTIKDRFGWEVHIVSAEEEARLSYLGTTSGFSDLKETCCVIDVGGGSTEISVGQSKNLLDWKSVPTGAVRLFEQGGKKETLCSGERLELVQFVKLLLENAGIKTLLSDVEQYIACGGTATTLAAVKKRLAIYKPGAVNGLALSRDEIWQMYFRLNDLTPGQRRALPGMESGRETVVLYGVLIILTLMEWLRIGHIRVSDRGLRYGFLADKLLKRG